MLPSKMSPTSSPARLTTGDPELPPMMSLVVTVFIGVDRSSVLRRSKYRFDSSNGGLLSNEADRSYSPNSVVLGGAIVPFMGYPFTCPYDSRSVKVASGYVV